MALDGKLDNIALFKYLWSTETSLTNIQRSVLMAIFIHRNNCTFNCFPSLDRIAECSALNRRTVRRTIKALVKEQRLVRVEILQGKRVTRTYYFSAWDFEDAKEIAEDEDSIFYKAGDDEIFRMAENLYDKFVPF